jgi:hypothetical protein
LKSQKFETITNPQQKQWELAIEDEYKSLFHNHNWILPHLPVGRKVVLCKWVFHSKTNANREIAKDKRRVVVKGFFSTTWNKF